MKTRLRKESFGIVFHLKKNNKFLFRIVCNEKQYNTIRKVHELKIDQCVMPLLRGNFKKNIFFLISNFHYFGSDVEFPDRPIDHVFFENSIFFNFMTTL